MKKVLNFGSLLLILTVLITACGKDPKIEQPLGNLEQGRFALQLGTMGSFEVITRATEEVEVGDFTVRVKGTTLKETAYDSTWSRYADMPSVITIPAGTYTISAYNGEQQSGFATPYYYGQKEFTVGIQELTDAQVICQLACVKLSVEFTSLFLSNVNDPVCIIHQSEGVSLQFDPEKNNSIGYIAAPADSTLAITIRGSYAEDGSEVNRTYFINQVGAKQWHKIALSVNTSAGIENEGGGMIKVDHSVDEKNSTVLVPGSGDLIDNNGDSGNWEDENNSGGEDQPGGEEKEELSMTGVSFNGAAFDIDQPIIVVGTKEELTEHLTTLDIQLKAPEGGIQKLFLQMESTDASTQAVFGGMGKMDLANPAGDSNAEMVVGIMGMDVKPVKGEVSYLFSIGGFMTLLPAPEASEGKEYNEHKFHITLEDGVGNTISKTLVIRRKEA